jgi:hypothetical protein
MCTLCFEWGTEKGLVFSKRYMQMVDCKCKCTNDLLTKTHQHTTVKGDRRDIYFQIKCRKCGHDFKGGEEMIDDSED